MGWAWPPTGRRRHRRVVILVLPDCSTFPGLAFRADLSRRELILPDSEGLGIKPGTPQGHAGPILAFMRPFRFLAGMGEIVTGPELAARAVQAEQLGYHAVVV